VFILIPVGIVRALGTTPIALGDDDEEDEDALAEAVGGKGGELKGEGKGERSGVGYTLLGEVCRSHTVSFPMQRFLILTNWRAVGGCM
jgi:hypothetical protein